MMMKQTYNLYRPALCGVLLIWTVTNPTFAEENNTKIGFVNVPQIMQEAPQAKEAQAKLAQEFSGQRKEMEECQEDLDILDGKLRRQGTDMTEEDRERMLDTIRHKQRECREMNDEVQGKYNQRRREELEQLSKLINGIIENIAAERKIDLVVGPPVIYISKQIDLTGIVLEELEKTK